MASGQKHDTDTPTWHIAPLYQEEYMPLRHQVLWPDKPMAFSRVPGDAQAQHYGVILNNALISCLSAFLIGENIWQIRKFATRPEYQQQGFGSTLLQYVIAQLHQQGAHTIELDARQSAAAFYQKYGFVSCSAEFEKSGISYIRMRRT